MTTTGGKYILYVLLGRLRFLALRLSFRRGSYMTRLALCLQIAHLLDEDAVDLEECRDAVLTTRRVAGRHG